MLVTTAQDLLIGVSHLLQNVSAGEYEKALESCLNIVNSALYLMLFLNGGIEYAVASLALQVLVGIYHSIGEFTKGNYLEAAGHVGMTVVRGSQLSTQLQMLRLKWNIPSLEKTAPSSQPKEGERTSKMAFNSARAVNGDMTNVHLIPALRVEHGYWNGVWAHIGYYANGITIVTFADGQQGAFQNGVLFASTSNWIFELVYGVNYVRHIYADGCSVYSTGHEQWIVW